MCPQRYILTVENPVVSPSIGHNAGDHKSEEASHLVCGLYGPHRAPPRPPTCRAAPLRRRSSPRFRCSPGRASTPVSTPATASTPATTALHRVDAAGRCRPVPQRREHRDRPGPGCLPQRQQQRRLRRRWSDRLQLPVHPGLGRGDRHRGRRPVRRLRPQPEPLRLRDVPAGGSWPRARWSFNPNGLSSLDFFGTVRGRLGYAFDRTLVYGTGGFAYGSGGGRQFGCRTAATTTSAPAGPPAAASSTRCPTDSFLNFFRSSAVTLKVEGLYVNLDNNNRNQRRASRSTRTALSWSLRPRRPPPGRPSSPSSAPA